MVLSLFWLSFLLLCYIYLGYPLVVCVLGLLHKRSPRLREDVPRVSILIAAFNEADVIAATLDNKLQLDYPAEKLDIIVISDASDDGTDEIVQKFADRNVRLLRQEPRAGKTSALNLAIKQATGDILVFSDANSIYDAQALHHLVANFSDPSVGYVTGKMVYVDPDGSMVGDGCSAYMRYENFLRRAETRIGSVVGVDGGIDAVRKGLYRPMRADQLPDFVLPLSVVEQGYRVVYEPQAILREATLTDLADEYRMRVRVSLRALWALWDMRQLLGFKHNPLFSWQLWSHKVLRYLCFVFLLMVLIANTLLLQRGGFFMIFFFLQGLCYGAAILMPWLKTRGYQHSLLNFCRYFLLLNLASAHAFLKFISGKKQVLWTPRKG